MREPSGWVCNKYVIVPSFHLAPQHRLFPMRIITIGALLFVGFWVLFRYTAAIIPI